MGQYRIDTATKVSVNRQRKTQSQITIFDQVQIWSARLKPEIVLQYSLNAVYIDLEARGLACSPQCIWISAGRNGSTGRRDCSCCRYPVTQIWAQVWGKNLPIIIIILLFIKSVQQLLCHQLLSFYSLFLSLPPPPPPPPRPPTAASGRCSTYLVFLPPRYHLLLKLSCVDSGVSVLLATDCWRALGLVNDHLHSLSTGTSDS